MLVKMLAGDAWISNTAPPTARLPAKSRDTADMACDPGVNANASSVAGPPRTAPSNAATSEATPVPSPSLATTSTSMFALESKMLPAGGLMLITGGVVSATLTSNEHDDAFPDASVALQ